MVRQQLSAIIGSRPRREPLTLRRMKPQQSEARLGARDFGRICQALEFIESHWQEQPTLERMASAVSLSPYYFNRLFHLWAGITPKAYVQLITGAVAKAGLRKKQPLLHTALQVGLSGPGRLHDLIVKLEAMSPAQYADGGAGLCIEYGVAESPFGLMLSGRTARGVCHLSFIAHDSRVEATRELRAQWPKARLRWSPESALELAELLWPKARTGSSQGTGTTSTGSPLRLLVRGSQFQLKVWQALLALDAGENVGYGELGEKLQQKGAARAIGGAVGANPIAWLIPCHRVLRAGGALGGYAWGTDRKRAILAWEQLRVG
jgi:AraC family transcriptional regulator, regulatory protein of adaptative response / methylated-DNA-[protein]-cysteine methyltransferase